MISLQTWLKFFSFVSNPFEKTEAGSEAYYATEFLHQTFVKPQGFDDILGHPSQPKSTIVFAARGQGKTSARLMTANFCQEGLFSERIDTDQKNRVRVLPVQHTRFEIFSKGAESQSDLVNIHVIEILYRALPALVSMLMRYPELPEKVRSLNILSRLELQFFLLAFRVYLSADEFKFAREVFGQEVVSLDETRTPIGFSLPNSIQQSIGLTNREIQNHLAAYTKAHPIDLLRRFVSLVIQIGFGAVYVLVDCLDEIPETAANFENVASVIVPLLSSLNLMTNTPYLAFKVFVPNETRENLLSVTRQVRRDRLAILEIQFSEQDLVEILVRRLSYCSEGVISSLDAVCEVGLRGQIMNRLVKVAKGNPRHLVLLGQFMLENRCQTITGEVDYFLTENDLQVAISRLQTEFQDTRDILSGKDIGGEFHSNNETHNMIVQQPPLEHSQDLPRDWFRHDLPAPIALSYLVYQREGNANQQLWKLYELVEASLAYMSLVLLAMLVQNLGDEASKRIKRSGLRLERTSLGIWRVTLEKLPGMLAGIGIKSAFARACQSLVHEHQEFLKTINDERNRSAHGGPQPDQVCLEILEQYDGPLHDFLADLQFLRNSHLIRVESVQKRGETYQHHCVHYIGDAVVYPKIEINLSMPLESENLWLVGKDVVKLHPWIITSLSGEIGEIVWMYHEKSQEKVVYKNYGAGKVVDSHQFVTHIRRVL